jgi:endonuclease G
MPTSSDRLARIAAAARERIASREARTQRSRVAKAFSENKPANAEPDPNRRLLRVQAVADVDAGKARKLLGGASPASLLTGDEFFSAERLIGDTVDYLPVTFLAIGQTAASSVARVIQRTGQPVGTGFLISKRLFVTNNHVIGSPEEAQRMLVEFDYETGLDGKPRATTRFALAPERFFVTDDLNNLDYTVVAVGERVTGARTLADFGFTPLSDRGDKHMLGEYVNLIEHPEGDYKQLVLRENKIVTRLDTVLHYEADTEPGASGSPVFNDEWEAVALHHWGGPHRETRGREGQPLPTTVNEGIRISAIVKALQDQRTQLSSEQKAMLDEALAAANQPEPGQPNQPGRPVSRPVDEGVASVPSNDGDLGAARTTGTRINSDGSITVGLEVNVRLTGVRPSLTGSESGGTKPPPDPDYASREGYDEQFLPGFDLPIPTVTSDAPGAKARLLSPSPGEDPFVLKYEHFSIIVNKTRKFPFVTAVNVDGQHSVKIDRKSGRMVAGGGDGDDGGDERAESAEATEKWYEDPRLDSDDQTDQPLYDHQSPRVFDRGHQVRREDPNWGNRTAAERANADTFHFANCCPQEFRFNEQVRYWAGIENYVLDNARTEGARVSVFTGPVFASTDPPYRGIRVPLQFFKVLARVEDGELKATAFVASQADLLSTLPERLSGAEGFDDLGAVREYATSVEEIEHMTGLDFGPLRDHDTFVPEAIGGRQPMLSEADVRAALGGNRFAPLSRRRPVRRPPVSRRFTLEGEALESGFAVESLSATSFDWKMMLSTALACQLSYADQASVEKTAVEEWGLATCEFLSVGDTQCFVASSSDTALLAFRGTESVGDWLANLDTLTVTRPYGKVHRGFSKALAAVLDEVLEKLNHLAKPRVVVTGHSLGGALATLFAAEAPSDLPIQWVHTYGQPRVGMGNSFTSFLGDRYGKRFVRVVNNNDIVPRVPPWPFAHVGRLVQFDGAGNVGGDPESLARPASMTDSPPALSDAEFRSFQQRLRVSSGTLHDAAAEGLFPSVADHAIGRYIAMIRAQIDSSAPVNG